MAIANDMIIIYIYINSQSTPIGFYCQSDDISFDGENANINQWIPGWFSDMGIYNMSNSLVMVINGG